MNEVSAKIGAGIMVLGGALVLVGAKPIFTGSQPAIFSAMLVVMGLSIVGLGLSAAFMGSVSNRSGDSTTVSLQAGSRVSALVLWLIAVVQVVLAFVFRATYTPTGIVVAVMVAGFMVNWGRRALPEN